MTLFSSWYFFWKHLEVTDYHWKGAYCIWPREEFWLAHSRLRQLQHILVSDLFDCMSMRCFMQMKHSNWNSYVYWLSKSEAIRPSYNQNKIFVQWDIKNFKLTKCQLNSMFWRFKWNGQVQDVSVHVRQLKLSTSNCTVNIFSIKPQNRYKDIIGWPNLALDISFENT